MIKYQIGNTLYVFVGINAAKKAADFASSKIATGKEIVYSDGSREWLSYDVIIQEISDNQSASDRYIWDKSGEKIKYERNHHKIAVDGTHTISLKGFVFRGF